MKSFIFLLLFPFYAIGQNPKAQLVNVECGKQIGISGEVGTSKELANLAFFPGFDLSIHADKVDQFLRENFLSNFQIDLLPKSLLLENQEFQAFKSPYFVEKNSGTDASGQHRSNSLSGAYSWGTGYIPWTYKNALTEGYDDSEAIFGFFPNVEYLITAELGFSYIIDSDLAVSPLLILEFRRVSDAAHKRLHYTVMIEESDEKRDAMLISPPDAIVTAEELEKSLDPLFQKMMNDLEHDRSRINKFLHKR